MQELINQLIKQLGVQPEQASGGAGLLLKLVQSKLGADFSKVAAEVPDVNKLIMQAPEAGGAAKLLGGLASSLGGKGAGDLASLAAGFSKLNLDPSMIQKFIPVILAFFQAKLTPETLARISSVIKNMGS